MKKILFLMLVLCTVQNSWAQSCRVRGIILDTLNNNPLFKASIVLIRVKDSVIESYTRAMPDGSFWVDVPGKGKYKLRITYPGFADYVDTLVADKPSIDLGTLPMVSKEHVLKEFVLTKQ